MYLNGKEEYCKQLMSITLNIFQLVHEYPDLRHQKALIEQGINRNQVKIGGALSQNTLKGF